MVPAFALLLFAVLVFIALPLLDIIPACIFRCGGCASPMIIILGGPRPGRPWAAHETIRQPVCQRAKSGKGAKTD
jgi:hypothetical protein